MMILNIWSILDADGVHLGENDDSLEKARIAYWALKDHRCFML